MSFPSLLNLVDENAYRNYWIKIYCKQGIVTFDGILVRFRKEDYDHAFFESIASKDDTFSIKRAERMDWIAATLKDPSAELYAGWVSAKKSYDHSRRVALVMGNYVVVIALSKKNKNQARFVTAYVADTPARSGRPSTVDMIRRSPKWK